MREFGRATARREPAQQAVEWVDERVDRFNGDKVPFYMEAYNTEMDVHGVNDAWRLEFFYQIAAPRIYAEVYICVHMLYVCISDIYMCAYVYVYSTRACVCLCVYCIVFHVYLCMGSSACIVYVYSTRVCVCVCVFMYV